MMKRTFLLIVEQQFDLRDSRKVIHDRYSLSTLNFVKKSPRDWKILKVKRVL